MTRTVDELAARSAALRARWRELGVDEAAAVLAAAPDAELLGIVDELAGLRRRVDALLAAGGAELGRRSRAELGGDALAKRLGHSSAAHLLADALAGPRAEAARLIAVGEAARPRQSLVGEALPAKRPHVAAALGAGTISIEQAAVITTMAERVRLRARPEQLDTAERHLVEQAPAVGYALLLRAAARWEAVLDEDGVAPAEAERREARGLSLGTGRDGMVTVRGRLDPETAAPVVQAVDALVLQALRASRDDDRAARSTDGGAGTGDAEHDAELDSGHGLVHGPGSGADAASDFGSGSGSGTGGDTATVDRRSLAQLRADALAEIATHALACHEGAGEAVPTTRAAATVVVRMHLDELRRELAPDGHDDDVPGYGAELSTAPGSAELEGFDRPVSPATARRLACDAGILPVVLGGDSEVLDLGRARRLFSRAQRRALAERDGGCAFPGCDRPPHWTEAHHVRWWSRDRGPSDLDNGILLCRFHHLLVHRGWRIERRDGRFWFIPPAHLDPSRRPRPGRSVLGPGGRERRRPDRAADVVDPPPSEPTRIGHRPPGRATREYPQPAQAPPTRVGSAAP